MNTSANQNNTGQEATRPHTGRVHPRVYGLLIGLALWFVLSVWGFAGAGATDYLLAIVSGFILVVVALVLVLSRVGRTNDAAERDNMPSSFRDWAAQDFDTWQSRLKGSQATVQILLPIAAAAFGMTAFGIALHIAEHGGV